MWRTAQRGEGGGRAPHARAMALYITRGCDSIECIYPVHDILVVRRPAGARARARRDVRAVPPGGTAREAAGRTSFSGLANSAMAAVIASRAWSTVNCAEEMGVSRRRPSHPRRDGAPGGRRGKRSGRGRARWEADQHLRFARRDTRRSHAGAQASGQGTRVPAERRRATGSCRRRTEGCKAGAGGRHLHYRGHGGRRVSGSGGGGFAGGRRSTPSRAWRQNETFSY